MRTSYAVLRNLWCSSRRTVLNFDSDAIDISGSVPPGYVPPPMASAAPMADNVAGTLCYVLGLVTGIIFLVMAPYNQNKAVRFHAFQSIFLNIAVIVLELVWALVFGIMFRIVGWWLAALVWPIFWLGLLFIWLYMMFQTYQGKTIVLPIIGPIARQQA